MSQKCETPHDGGASRNQLGGWLLNRSKAQSLGAQALPDLVVPHIGREPWSCHPNGDGDG